MLLHNTWLYGRLLDHKLRGGRSDRVVREINIPHTLFFLILLILKQDLKYFMHDVFFVCLYNLRPAALRLIVRSWLDIPTFTTRRLHASPRESTQRRKVELWARNVRQFCLNADIQVTFRDLLHAVKLRHGTDGFTSPPKEGVLRIFSP